MFVKASEGQKYLLNFVEFFNVINFLMIERNS